MPRYWIGIASAEHVQLGVQGGFCQLCHGKAQPLHRMQAKDWIIYYSPKHSLHAAEKCQAFTAIGRIKDSDVYEFQMGEQFRPYRRNVDFFPYSRPVSLQTVSAHPLWSQYRSQLRYGHLEIDKELFLFIAGEMGLPLKYSNAGKIS
ncbi:EVE domain-containing protein [Paenibacillus sp. BAC0078]